jgi:hypothetical protein
MQGRNAHSIDRKSLALRKLHDLIHLKPIGGFGMEIKASDPPKGTVILAHSDEGGHMAPAVPGIVDLNTVAIGPV